MGLRHSRRQYNRYDLPWSFQQKVREDLEASSGQLEDRLTQLGGEILNGCP